MKDLRAINQYAVGILLLTLGMLANNGGVVQAAYTMIETCKWAGNGYIGNPADCQGWGLCKQGLLTGSGKCGAGMLYDMESAVCRTAGSVECRTTSVNVCSNVKENKFVGDPNNCNRYCYCQNGGATCKNCPSTQVYDAASNACIWGSDTGFQCPADSICRLVPNNQFVGDPTAANCGNYMRCVGGTGSTTSCKAGYNYNPNQGGCVENYSACSGNVAPGSGLPPKTSATACATYTGTKVADFFVVDGVTCYGYYVCASKTAVGIWGSCRQATHFDAVHQACNNPNQVVCQQDRCGNLNLQFVDNLGCTTYRYCQNGRAVASALSQSCPAGHPNFDETRGGCVAASLQTWPICSTKLTSL